MQLNCSEFERLINEQLDAGEAAAVDVERSLAAHEAACPACRATALRYQTLRQAIAAWTLHPPQAPADFVARFQEGWESRALSIEDRMRAILTFPSAFRLISAAAALMLAVWLGGRSGWRPPVRPAAPPQLARRIDPDALSNALAEATTATWELARATSAPAARVGREVLDTAAGTETTAPLSLPDEVGPTVEILEEVGQRVNEGVTPLSGTARHAFGFLLGNSGG